MEMRRIDAKKNQAKEVFFVAYFSGSLFNRPKGHASRARCRRRARKRVILGSPPNSDLLDDEVAVDSRLWWRAVRSAPISNRNSGV